MYIYEAKSSRSKCADDPGTLCHCRESNGQASGGDDAGNDDWIFNTIREKDLKKFQNGAAQPAELESKPVRPHTIVEGNKIKFHVCLRSQISPFDI